MSAELLSSEITNCTNSSEIDLFNTALESQYLNVESSQAEFDSDSEIDCNEQSAQTMDCDIPTNTSHENLEYLTNSVKKKITYQERIYFREFQIIFI